MSNARKFVDQFLDVVKGPSVIVRSSTKVIDNPIIFIHAGIKKVIEGLTRAQSISLLIGFGWTKEEVMAADLGEALMAELEFSAGLVPKETAQAIINLITVALVSKL